MEKRIAGYPRSIQENLLDKPRIFKNYLKIVLLLGILKKSNYALTIF
jgi:hypothetical protein